MAHRKKRGRPRKQHVKRTASGRIAAVQPADCGTPEGVRNRALLIDGAPVELAANAISVLLAGGHIEVKHAVAAGWYAKMRARCFGLARPLANWDTLDLSRIGSPLPEERQANARRRFEAMVARLDHVQKIALDRLVVNDKLPGWFRLMRLGRRLTATDEAERGALLGALDALVAD